MKRPEDIDHDYLRKLLPDFRLDWSGMRNRLEEGVLAVEKQATYEMRAAHLDELARAFEDAVARALLAERQAATAKEREACARLIEEGFDKQVGQPYAPGHRSKNDYCPHQRFMYEDCEQCAAQAIRSRP